MSLVTFQRGELKIAWKYKIQVHIFGNHLDVIIDHQFVNTTVYSGASSSVALDKYRWYLENILFSDTKNVILKVGNVHFIQQIGKLFCVLL